jgi:hypothetical protein
VTTTTAPNTTTPTAPTNLTGYSDGGGEAIMSWNGMNCPFGAAGGRACSRQRNRRIFGHEHRVLSAKGAPQHQPRATPWVHPRREPPSPACSRRRNRRIFRHEHRALSAKGAPQHQPRATPWVRPAPNRPALKGRAIFGTARCRQ